MNKIWCIIENINIEGINRRTIVSIGMIVLVAINQVLVGIGKPALNLGEEQVTMVINTALNLLITFYCAWKNNSITENAQIADDVLYALRDGKISKKEVDEFLDKYYN